MAAIPMDVVVTGPKKSVADVKAQRQPTTKLCDDLEGEAFQEWRQANDQLMGFYRDNKLRLDEIDYGTVAATLSPVVASCFRGSSWKDFACALGIPDSELEGVDQWAEHCKLMPLHVALQHLYPALKACSKRCSLGHLIDVLKEQGRLDVLNKISPQVKGFLSESPHETCYFEKSHHKKLEDSESSLSSVDSGVSSLDAGDFLGDPAARDSILIGSAPKQAALPYSPCSRNGAFVSEAFSPESNSRTTPPSFANPDNVSLSLNNNDHTEEEESICGSLIDQILPKTKLDKLTVFVSHLEEDIDLAQELAKILETEHECYVLTQAEIQPALHTDPTLIEDLIQKVKAIVPLITRAYLDHYEHSRRTTELNSADSVLTREVYSLFLHRLVSNSCLYYMLFPVRTPDVKYAEVRRHHIFSKSKVLCKEDLAQLVINMHRCRKLRLSNERRGS
uniref:Death domain-containing protein n=1 Tax=Rhipicephalus appendiculatus TaxID=34631 RepID=A0A131Z154_RHIAP